MFRAAGGDPTFPPGDNRQYVPGVGFEYLTGGNFPVRAGYSYDSRASSHFASAGLGLLGDSGGLDLAHRPEFGGAGSKLIALTIRDPKSTRLKPTHPINSYSLFCLLKKKK